MRWTALAALMLSACASSGATDPAPSVAPVSSSPATTMSTTMSTTVSTTMSTTVGDGTRPDGFDRAMARVTETDGTICEICVWVADTSPQRSRGLMFVTDLGDADAMAFVYPEPHTGTFWMKNTVIPLSIAFFAPDGTFISSFDMEPCLTEECPNYRTADDFLVAVEVPLGGLADMGLVTGSRLELLDLPCTD